MDKLGYMNKARGKAKQVWGDKNFYDWIYYNFYLKTEDVP